MKKILCSLLVLGLLTVPCFAQNTDSPTYYLPTYNPGGTLASPINAGSAQPVVTGSSSSSFDAELIIGSLLFPSQHTIKHTGVPSVFKVDGPVNVVVEPGENWPPIPPGLFPPGPPPIP